MEEIFEARPVKKSALMAPIDGQVAIEEISEKKQKVIKITGYETKKQKFVLPASEVDGLQFKDGDKIKKGEVIFESKNKKIKADLNGKIEIDKGKKEWQIKIEVKKKVVKELPPVRGTVLWVKEGEEVTRGQQLSEGALDLRELYELRGQQETQKYIIKEIQYIYSSQGQKLNDKHVEIIAHQMFSRIFITEPGETDFSPGEVIEMSEFNDTNKEAEKNKKKLAEGNIILLGITKASLSTSSFLSASSFQETARILIDAAVSGKIDYLRGLKENVIIGRLIPAGTGLGAHKKN
ncbi:hypothetical protein A3J77_01225 [Candidatus Wolfebacteria bacterium RBG_13_41_7]|uniref:RNA polymerase Rpb1 domain-containing protein n=1 Tax=Candidatus Wolfebacteria bacterium RBG_13_41_7 TaxID=1802554 RepID=A0A1F8DM57_9BACT|nr:MAG: hypothetical protein A3J77_01225 [Candidatus Wolfebacteria bacterium RBG_13_41_7]